jgi:hypothetical protein
VRLIKKLICALKGHDVPDAGPFYLQSSTCRRCGVEFADLPERW